MGKTNERKPSRISLVLQPIDNGYFSSIVNFNGENIDMFHSEEMDALEFVHQYIGGLIDEVKEYGGA